MTATAPTGLRIVSSAGTAPPNRTLGARVEILVLVLAIATGIAAWGVGICTLGYDYDEVMRAHSIWLAAQGLRPYRDFLDCHPPYFVLLTPFVRSHADDPGALLWSLRLLSAAGNLLFLGGLLALGAASVASRRRFALLGITVVAFHPAVLEFLVEFRIDGWGYALAVWSIYRFRQLPRGAYRGFELGVLTGIASLLICPKLALLPPLIIVFEQLFAWEPIRIGVRACIAYLAGLGVAAGLFALYLMWHGIDFDRTFQILVRYNAVSNANLDIRPSLLENIVHMRVLFWATLAGVGSWAVDHVRHRSRPQAYEVALAVWLVAQPLLVSYPSKQYYAPWFLLASCFLVYLCRDVSDLLGRTRVLGFVAVCALTALADLQTTRRWSEVNDARTHDRLLRWMNRVTRSDDRVVASPPLHPIDRYDSFFLWFNTLDQSGFDGERILAQLPMYRDYVIPGRFREELDHHPPALVVLAGDWRRFVPYTPGQQEALADFFRRHGYLSVHIGSAWFALRPDRFEQARRSGLLDAAPGPPAAPRW